MRVDVAAMTGMITDDVPSVGAIPSSIAQVEHRVIGRA